MMSINLNKIAILSVNGVDYHCIINRISKIDALNLFLKNANYTIFFTIYIWIKKL